MILRTKMKLLSLTLGVSSYGLLIWIDYRIAIGVFLAMWANNIQRTWT